MRASAVSPPPRPRRGSTALVDVWSVALDGPPAELRALERTLSRDERARASRFAFARDRRRFVACRGAVRSILAAEVGAEPPELSFAYGDHGRPRLAGGESGVDFNVAHAHELALVAVARGGTVGVDVELVRPLDDLDGLAASVFAPGELASLRGVPAAERTGAFFAGWTRKEAFVKAVGDGVSFGLDRFEVALAPGEPVALRSIAGDATAGRRWTVAALAPAAGYVGAVAVDRPDAGVHGRRWPGGEAW